MDTPCPICGSPATGRRKYCSETCRAAGRRANTRKAVAAHRRRSNVIELGVRVVADTMAAIDEPPDDDLDGDDDSTGAESLDQAIASGSPERTAQALARILGARIRETAAVASESGLAALSKELRECMRVVAEGGAPEQTELGQILSMEHRFGGA
jgi:endogenous inhibitor of DNA gyrase (YacG/DUF329 family)